MTSYRDKKVLVVDDFPEFRMSIRQMLLSLKIQDIHMANTGEEALKASQRHRFDIVLCDYNLGDGKDGQQLLEELREYKLLKNTSIFMMLTAENTAFMVMGALENCPDAYLMKPFTRQDLKARLDRLCLQKDELEEVNYALDCEKYEAAIEGCREIIQSKSKLSTQALKIQASILLKTGRQADAEKLFKMVIDSRPVVWAQMGYAKTLYNRAEYEQSLMQLDKIIESNSNYLDAYDLMAENHCAMGNAQEAQKILTKAVAKSAKSPQRQHRLAKVARLNKDIDTAARALKRTVELSQNGLYENPANVLEYVEVLRDKAEEDTSLAGKRASADALNVLDKYKKDIRKNPETNVYAKVLESKIFTVQKKEKDATQSAKEACQLQKLLGATLGPSVLCELTNTMLEVGEYEDAANLLSELTAMDLETNPDQENIESMITTMLENEELREFHNALNENNKKGVALYDKGLLEDAIIEFRQAVSVAQDSVSINLNLVQGIIKLMQSKDRPSSELFAEAQSCFDRIGDLDRSNPRFSRYSDLQKLHQGFAAQ